MRKTKSSRSLSTWLSLGKDEPADCGGSSSTSTRQASSLASNDKPSHQWERKPPAYNSRKRSVKRRCLSKSSIRDGDGVPWCVKHAPCNGSELAVHKKKVQEVTQWMQFSLSKNAKHPILLLSGPCGCGKTATVRALSNDLGFEIVEWNDPVDTRPSEDASGFENPWELFESQTKKFLSFIVRANRYPTLQLLGGGVVSHCDASKGKIVLVEEFPNVFIRDPKKLHLLLKDIVPQLIHPLVFIVSESQHTNGTYSRLFPPAIVSDLDIHQISFNPIARTSTLKTLQRIARAEAAEEDSSIQEPGKDVLEGIAECCTGDIRAAINILQFTCQRVDGIPSAFDMSTDSSSSRERAHQQLEGVAGREQPLFLFRALGKILYCKRDDSDTAGDTLPPHLSHCKRPHLLTDPELVYESAHLSSELFTAYLHQNYLDFFEHIEDVDPAIGYLCDSDVIGNVWTETQDRNHSLAGSCCCSVASRGLMFTNTQTSSSRWRPLFKPKWTSVWQQFLNNMRTARELFLHPGGVSSTQSHLWMPVDLVTELLPYMAVVCTNTSVLRNQSQASFLFTLGTYRNTRHYSHKSELLGETEQDEDGSTLLESDSGTTHMTDGTGLSLSEQNATSTSHTTSPPTQQSSEVEEEYLDIEEFDDD